MKNWKHEASTPEFLSFKIVSPETWKQAKERMLCALVEQPELA